MALSDDPRTNPFSFLQQLNQNSANNTALVTQAAARKRSLLNRAGYSGGGYSVQGLPANGDLQSYAQSQLAKYGWGSDQWGALQKLFQRESGWNPNAINPSSGAWGIAQILPSAHPDVKQNNNGQMQIDWGLNYIKNRYGNPNNAWGHETSIGWY